MKKKKNNLSPPSNNTILLHLIREYFQVSVATPCENAVSHFSYPYIIITPNRSIRQKINKERAYLNSTVYKMDLTKYRIFHPRPPKYTFFSSTHGTFSSRDHMLRHKASLNKFKNIDIMSSICSLHSGIKLEVNSRRKMGKFTHM